MTTALHAFAQNRRLGRGVNIIGYDPLWESRGKARMQDKHFRLIRDTGFDHVRINIHPFSHMGETPDYAIDTTWLETLDWAVAQALANDLLVIIDMHEFNAMGADPEGLKPKFLATWEQLAPRYQDTPDTVLFELLNEPNKGLTPALWNELLLEPYEIIRRTNPHRTLIIGPAFWNGIDYLDELELPEDDENIIVTVHYYHPMPFTHQGAHWTEYVDQLGVTWEGTPEETALIQEELGGVQAWAKAHDRPIYLGEFGAYDRADMPSRVRYTSFMAREAERLGWSWGYWQFDSDFIVYNIDEDRWVKPILNALVPPETTSAHSTRSAVI
ncbi:MAG: glycoside hydrolase family 5 protein [Anaerolineae bacterium]|nr:glycoside hydrolase family 5 protein [Anaerolineae bacterium]